MTRPTLFIDDVGVLNDNSLRGPQWQTLVGEYFAPVLGGSPDAWAQANSRVIRNIIAPAAWQQRLQAATDYTDFERNYYIDWLTAMCKIVGVSVPADDDAVELSRHAYQTIIPQVQAAIPGAADTIRLLHSQGYTLYTASGGSSSELSGHFSGMGITECFTRLYGPDLIGAFKSGPEFYRRILEDTGVEASNAIVVDDSLACLAWAAALGMRCVLIGSIEAEGVGGRIVAIPALTGLPAILSAS